MVQKSLLLDTRLLKSGSPGKLFHIDTTDRTIRRIFFYTSPLLFSIARSLSKMLGIKIIALQISQEPNAHG